MGWTGLQYSIGRIALALLLAAACVTRIETVDGAPRALLAICLPGAVALALGWRDRAVAANLLVLWSVVGALVDGAPLVAPRPDVPLISAMLLLHLFAPITPFGSWDARDRIDPRGGWRRPAWIGHAAWSALVIAHALAILRPASAPWVGGSVTLESAIGLVHGALVLGAGVALPGVALRRPIWSGLVLLTLAQAAAASFETGALALLLLHAFAADPAWWPGRGPRTSDATPSERSARLFYDGDCGFCHNAVRIVLSEDEHLPARDQLRFAPLGGEAFREHVGARPDVDADALPDSIVLVTEDGTLLTRSAAALEIAARLGGFWRGLAWLGALVPSGLLDALYDGIARVRKRLVATPDGACPILPPALRARFDA